MTKAKPKAQTPARNKPAGTQQPTIKEVASSITKKVDGTLLKYDDTIIQGKQKIADGMQLLTAVIAMRDLTPIQLRDVYDYTKSVTDATDEASKLIRGRVLDYALKHGEHTGTNNASLKIDYGDGKYQLIKAKNTGTDPKKFEANLRAKGKEVSKYMAQVISYKMSSDFDGPQKAIDDGIFTTDEVKAMAHEPSYAVERSKEGKTE